MSREKRYPYRNWWYRGPPCPPWASPYRPPFMPPWSHGGYEGYHMEPREELRMLEDIKKDFEDELDQINKRIDELKSSESKKTKRD